MNLHPKFYNSWWLLFLMIIAVSCFSQLPPLPPEVSPAELRVREQQRHGRRTVAKPETSLPQPAAATAPAPAVSRVQPAQQRILDQLENNRRRALPVVTFGPATVKLKPKVIRSPRDETAR